ncbi:MAG: hypothetical protein ACJ76V_02115 [Thermoleophilaceae bacterium]
MAGALVLAVPGSALAAGGVQVSPSRIDARVKVGGRIPRVTVRNTSALPVSVSAQPLLATQDLSGQPSYDTSAASRRRGSRLLRLAPSRFTLPPGGARRVSATVLACPQVGVGSYGVILFSGRQAAGHPPSGTTAQVTPVLRLATTFLLSYPATPCIDGEVSALRGDQVAHRVLGFFARVRNLGDLHAKPAIRLAIVRHGRAVFRGAFGAENVIPRASRDYELVLPARLKLPKGRYVAVAEARMGPRRSRIRWPFELTGTNLLPSARLALSHIAVSHTASGSAPEIAAVIRNSGTAPAPATVRLTLSKLGGSPLETRVVRIRSVAVRGEATARTGLAKLPRGEYEAAAELLSNGDVISVKRLTFGVAPAPSLVARAVDWVAAHVLAVAAAALGLLAFLLLLAVALLLRRRRRLRRPPVDTGAAPRAPEPELLDIKRELAELRELAQARDLAIAEERVDVHVPEQPPSVLDGLLLTRRAVAASIHRRRRVRSRAGD